MTAIAVDDVSSIARSLRGALLVLFKHPLPGRRVVETESYGMYLASLLGWCGLRDDLRLAVVGANENGLPLLRVEALTEKGRAVRDALRFANGEPVQLDA